MEASEIPAEAAAIVAGAINGADTAWMIVSYRRREDASTPSCLEVPGAGSAGVSPASAMIEGIGAAQ